MHSLREPVERHVVLERRGELSLIYTCNCRTRYLLYYLDTCGAQCQLTEGQGEKYYGVMVAKYLMKTDHFNNRTKELS